MTRSGTPLTRMTAPIGLSEGAKRLATTVWPITATSAALLWSSVLMPRPVAICQLVIGG